MIDVTVEDQVTRTPIEGLTAQDFRIFDNGSPFHAYVFIHDSSAQRPITIWFLMSCREKERDQGTSGFAHWSGDSFKQVLANLNSSSTVGVAHWCANGDAEIDVLPTHDYDAPLVSIGAVLRQAPVESSRLARKPAFQRALNLVTDISNLPTPETRPVIVIMDDGRPDITKDEANLISKRLIHRGGAIVYLIENHRQESIGAEALGKHSTLEFISRQTGGRIYRVHQEEYPKAVNSIITGLLARYTLGVFIPRSDGRWHELRVQLADSARRKHKSGLVAYPAGYLSASSPYSTSNRQRTENSQLAPGFAEAIDGQAVAQEIRFRAEAKAFVGLDQLVEFTIRLNSDQLSWTNLPGGNRRSQIAIVVASYSNEGKRLGYEVAQLDITRDDTSLPITGDMPFTDSETITLPVDTSRIRVMIGDLSQGKVGFQDFALNEILKAPRLPAVIR